MTTTISKLLPALQQALQDLGYKTLTPVQEQAIPQLLGGRDLICQSKTGSGKTAAFMLPLLNRLKVTQRRTQALILCPTRELCAQVAREARKLGRGQPDLQVIAVAGGQPFRPQALALEHGAHIVVGTPGRVLDHIGRGTLRLGSLTTLVIDEADRMLDMGFEDDMRAILDACPKSRQTALFSATFPPAIEAISRAYLSNPGRVTVGDAEENNGKQAQSAIRQFVVEADHDDKTPMLLWLLREHNPQSSIVFCNQKATADQVASALTSAGVSATALHGDLEQRDRDKVLAKFRNRSIRTLVATDVAARGLDIEAVDVVFNFDIPPKPETYVHRIGRTGRAGKSGVAIAIATSREQRKIDMIESSLSISIQRQTPPSAAVLAATPPASQAAPMATLKIGGGRKAKVRPGDILGALTGEAGRLPADAVGKIEIHDTFSYVAVARKYAASAHASLQQGHIKGRKFWVDLEF